MNRIDFKNHLNEEQLAAATGPDGVLLVLAAAGTGKTRTLVYRVAHIIEKGIDPERILLLTFTNRAAREMLERAEIVSGRGIGGIWGGTFHHMANRILRHHAGLVGYARDYAILDGDDSRSIIGRCMTDLKVDKKDFPKRDVLLSLLSASVNTGTPLSEMAINRFGDSIAGYVVRVVQGYIDKKQALGAMDFDDLLVNCLRLFDENSSILERYQEKFAHVLVDEYQDTNAIQAGLVDKIVSKNRNLFVVGDDFQCIYSWRGADYHNILTFQDRYPDTQIYKLETNYRSTPEILEVANASIKGNPDQFQKTLRPTREKYKKPCVVNVRDGGEQARYVVSLVRQMRREGYSLSDMVVLYRAHFHGMELQMQLIRDNVSYTVTSGVRFFEQAHIKDICSILRVLESSRDEIAFFRLVQLMPGIGIKRSASIWRKIKEDFNIRNESSRKRLVGMLPVEARSEWAKIDSLFFEYGKEEFHKQGGAFIQKFVEVFYSMYLVNTYENYERRLEDIQELALYIDRCGTVSDFLNDVALMTNVDSEYEHPDHNKRDYLKLSTVHQAKGLEWPVVIILWVTEGMFPSARAVSESVAGEAEERRLFYVAVTRAKDELCICVPQVRRTRDGGVFTCDRSKFVQEIPAGLVDECYPGFI